METDSEIKTSTPLGSTPLGSTPLDLINKIDKASNTLAKADKSVTKGKSRHVLRIVNGSEIRKELLDKQYDENSQPQAIFDQVTQALKHESLFDGISTTSDFDRTVKPKILTLGIKYSLDLKQDVYTMYIEQGLPLPEILDSICIRYPGKILKLETLKNLIYSMGLPRFRRYRTILLEQNRLLAKDRNERERIDDVSKLLDIKSDLYKKLSEAIEEDGERVENDDGGYTIDNSARMTKILGMIDKIEERISKSLKLDKENDLKYYLNKKVIDSHFKEDDNEDNADVENSGNIIDEPQ